jgi:hypothetical protein
MLWNQKDVCSAAQLALLTEQTAAAGGGNLPPLGDISNVGRFYRTSVALADTLIDTVLTGFNPHDTRTSLDTHFKLTGDILSGVSGTTEVLTRMQGGAIQDKQAAWSLGLRVAQAKVAEESSKFPLSYVMQSVDYLYKYSNPQFIPEQGELDLLRAKGKLPYDSWACMTKAHGNFPEWRKGIVDLAKTQPNPGELVMLKNRQQLPIEHYVSLMANAGLDEPFKRAWYENLSVYVPSPGDLVRFMVRDVFDSGVVSAYRLDDEFELKFYGPHGAAAPGPAAQWAAAQGMTADQFKYYWYAHWEIPSNTALYEIAHRLRSDRPEVNEFKRTNPQWNGKDRTYLGGAAPIVVDISDIATAIKVNDMSPTWVDPLIAIAYHPINKTDATALFHSGAIDRNGLLNAYKDNGYSDKDAKTLVKGEDLKHARTLANLAGTFTIRKLIKAYQDGTVSAAQADAGLASLVPDGGQRATMLADADKDVDLKVKQAKMVKAKRGYYVGFYTTDDVTNILQNLQIPAARVDQLVQQWTAARDGRYKEPTVKIILDWVKTHIMSPQDAYTRFLNLGYVAPDAARLAAQAQAVLDQQAAQIARQAQAQNSKLIKSNLAMQRETDKAQLARMKEIDKQIIALQKEKDKVDKWNADRQAKVQKVTKKSAASKPVAPGG